MTRLAMSITGTELVVGGVFGRAYTEYGLEKGEIVSNATTTPYR